MAVGEEAVGTTARCQAANQSRTTRSTVPNRVVLRIRPPDANPHPAVPRSIPVRPVERVRNVVSKERHVQREIKPRINLAEDTLCLRLKLESGLQRMDIH